MMNTRKDYLKVNNEVKSSAKPCAVCSRYSLREFVDFYDKLKNGNIVDEKPVCDKCYQTWRNTYNQALNKEELSISLEHYYDILYSVQLKNICYQHEDVEDNKVLRKNLANIVNDYEESMKQKRYLPIIETEQDALKVLRNQRFQIEADNGPTKYIIRLPEGRECTTETEAEALCKLSKRPVIANMEKKFFKVLKEDV